MKKVIVLQPVMAHYRRTFFELLLANEDYDIEFIAGEKYLDIKSIENIQFKRLKYFSLKILSHRFYYLRTCLKYILSKNPDIIVSGGVDFHLLHTLIVFLVQRIIKRNHFFWWSHATTENYSKFGRWIRKQFYKKSSGILTYSNKGKDDLIDLGIPDELICVLGNSLNTEDYGFLNYDISERQTETTDVKILFAGRVNNARRIDILLKALYSINKENSINFKCTIVGAGETDSLKTICQKYHIDNNVHFVGAKYGVDIAKYFIDADIFVFPKAIGLSIVQAFSYGVPVITSNKLEIQMPEVELLSPGVTGDFYMDEDADDLALKIVEWGGKIRQNKKIVADSCIQQIKDYQYLPEDMLRKFLLFLKGNTFSN